MGEYPANRYPHQELTHAIIGAAFRVHNRLGHSFLEKIYERALTRELRALGLHVENQKKLEVNYGGEPIGDFAVDLLVEHRIIVEIKAVQSIAKSDEGQLLHYLRVSGIEVGLLINFGRRVQVKRKVFTQPGLHPTKSA
jgi:GxxExxY protein